MALSPGTRLGPYEILSPLGAGGMGEVYRARDTRLDRLVAVKVLPGHLSGSPELRVRFEREARAVSSLNHPNICTLHDIGSQDGTNYIVMECLEGETLAARLERGPLPVEDLLRCGIQIGDALDKAHRQGLIHRDLKPGNVMLSKTGAKLLDFGLARSVGPAGGPGAMTVAPTMSSPLTAEGAIVGTYQYMAPEQLEGSEADARSDIFAFGLILYEMAAGRRAFHGKTQASLIAAILKEEPRPISEFRPVTPPALEKLVRTCLEKDPENRRQTMRDVVLDLRWIAEGRSDAGSGALPAGPASRRPSERLWMGLAVAFFLAAVGLGFLVFGGARPDVPALIASIPPPQGAAFEFVGLQGGTPALSPDGKRLAFVARGAEGRTSLWLRPLDQPGAQRVHGTEGATSPFWSADSRTIAFFAEGKLKRVADTGGPALAICDAPDGRGGSWNADGVIVFAPNRGGEIRRVAATGGVSTPVTKLDPSRETETHRWPSFLPDGSRFLFLSRFFNGVEQVSMLCVGNLEGGPIEELFAAPSNAAYASGHLLFMRDTTLMAQRMNASSLKPTGDPFPVAERVQWDGGFARGAFSASSEGTLVYQTGAAQVGSRLVWLDRSGVESGDVGGQAQYIDVGISPDGRSLVLSISDPQVGPPDLWIHDLSRGVRSRFTYDSGAERYPVWSPDGTQVVYRLSRSSTFDLRVKPLSGPGEGRSLFESPAEKLATGWSSDGRLLLLQMRDPNTGYDLWVLTLPGDRPPVPFLQTRFNEESARFSADGRWVVYASDESGRYEIYAAPFPGPGRRWQISAAGGSQPRWSRDGREIFYLSAERTLMSVAVRTGDGSIEVGEAKPFFQLSYSVPGAVYDASPDGRRFLVNTPIQRGESPPLTLRLNWTGTLNR